MKKIRKIIRLFEIISPDYTFGVAGIILLIVIFSFSWHSSNNAPNNNSKTDPVSVAYQNLNLTSRAVYVFDVVRQQELFSLQPEAQLPLASLTKIMMAVTALSFIPENLTVTINQDFLSAEGDSGLFSNEKWKLKDLIDLTLLQSSNDGADAIAAVVGAIQRGGVPDDLGRDQFIHLMNQKAVELNLEQTYFYNPTGLDENEFVSGSYGSARDVAHLFSYALNKYPQLFEATRHKNKKFESLSDLIHDVENTNVIANKIPSLLGSKTGYTDLAGGNLAIAFNAGVSHPIVIVVLGSTEQGRFEDVEKLVWATLGYLKDNQGL